MRVLRTLSVDGAGARVGPLPQPGAFDLVVDGVFAGRAVAPEGAHHRLDFSTKRGSADTAPLSTVVFDGLPGVDAEIEVWLPFEEITTLVALRADGEVEPSRRQQTRWVHHGSSISQGVGARSGASTWPAIAAREAGLDLLNLGLAGNAVVDPFVARTLRDAPADLISVKLGINVVNHDVMRRRAFEPAVEGFLATIRDGHPSTPLVVVSPVLCPLLEDLPGPTYAAVTSDESRWYLTKGTEAEVAEGKLSLSVVREVLAEVVERRRRLGDAQIWYVDGRTLYGEQDWAAHQLPDNLHPAAESHVSMGRAFAVELMRLGLAAHVRDRVPASISCGGSPSVRDGR
ncbi:lipase [Pseudoclavibacter sp. Marseille-Q4354]|nr:GDSL-type esterase/lipase family protein [Pseudoclavibacter sp. Marseille-Q4354]MBS3179860.1 lipase [Pseudoclavibacter sp. Marseille-Q4354]